MFVNERSGAQGGASVQGVPALWAADPHQYGNGKVHIIDGENAKQTMCGRWLHAVPGKKIEVGRATCQVCLNAVENRARNQERSEEYERQRLQRSAEYEQRRKERDAQYSAYLLSPQWKARRAKVMKRAGGICEACLERRATQVHHLTYARIFNEPCFDLRAICDPCHDAIHSTEDGGAQ